jgi:hypothetical protein
VVTAPFFLEFISFFLPGYLIKQWMRQRCVILLRLHRHSLLIPHVPTLTLDHRFITTSLTSPPLQALFGMVRNRSPAARPDPKSRASHASTHLFLHNQPRAIDHRGPQPLLSSIRLPDITRNDWNMRFSVVSAAMDAHVQNEIMLCDRTRNLAVVGRQPHPNPNCVTRHFLLVGTLTAQ